MHRQIKQLYAAEDARFEVTLGKFRIDVVSLGRLIEVQHGSLAAIRDKVRTLVEEHPVVVVKPITQRKRLVRLSSKGGEVLGRRLSPKRGRVLDLFNEMVYFTRAFPHRRLTLDVALVEVEERRYPGHGRRRRHRANDFQIEDQKLLTLSAIYRIHSTKDLGGLIDCPLPRPFHTGHLSEGMGITRWLAQRITYTLRRVGTIREVGKQGNARLYEFAHRRRTLKPLERIDTPTALLRAA